MVKTKIIDENFVISCPYDRNFIEAIKRIGGHWDGKFWIVDYRQQERAEDILLEIYGENGVDGEKDVVDIRLTGTAWADSEGDSELSLYNRRIAYRPGRDAKVRFGHGVVVVDAEFLDSSGSAKYPTIGLITENPVFEVYNVPKSLYEKIKDRPGVEILPSYDSVDVQIEKLKARKEKLLSEIKGIDVAIAKLSGES